MELKKFLSASLACTLCITMLTACSGNENPSETSDTAINTDIDNNSVTTTEEVTTLKELAVIEAEINPEYRVITVNGDAANTNPASAYRGLGAVTGNNSSRLLMDYKEKNPDRYWEIMNLLFKKDYGAGLTHVKIEFGTDVNSSSVTEPSTMRAEDEKANVRRGAGFMFAADALSINPDITVDLLRWGEPKWVTDAFEEGEEKGHEARYKWYKETIDAAYDEYGIKFSYISADANEAEHVDVNWLIYFSDRLKNESDKRYDYSQIKIVASDEVGSWNIAKEMIANEELRSAVDVLAEHYNTWASNDAKILNTEYEKEIWYSEGVASTNIAKLAVTSNESGINGVNGCLDVCNRIINGYYNGTMVMYEYQPAVAAYYSGAKFFPKSIINAIEPWSGYYEPDAGIWTSAHFTMFAEKGWQYIDGACYGDGKESHSITQSTNNYMTLTNPETGDYSIIVCNDSDAERNYTFNVSNLNKAQDNIYIWETTGPKTEAEAYNANYLQLISNLKPVNNGDGTYSYSISVKPYSIITITTLQKDNVTIPSAITCPVNSEVLTLPYSDNFEYSEEFINSRAGTPLYTTDQGGAFEVAVQDGNSVFNADDYSGKQAHRLAIQRYPQSNNLFGRRPMERLLRFN